MPRNADAQSEFRRTTKARAQMRKYRIEAKRRRSEATARALVARGPARGQAREELQRRQAAAPMGRLRVERRARGQEAERLQELREGPADREESRGRAAGRSRGRVSGTSKS
jgi:hypothetical protein